MMKIVIDISEEMYKEIYPIEYSVYGLSSVKNKQLFYQLVYAIQKGTPLPEHHGNLIDRDGLYDNAKLCHTEEDGTACIEWREINDAPTIIERSDSK